VYGPTQAVVRVAAQDTVLAGVDGREGETVYAMLIAANAIHPGGLIRNGGHPPSFSAHLGFGVGSHFCVGAPLARLETRVALQTLLRLAPEYRLRGVDYGDSFFARGPNAGVIDIGAHHAGVR
jgi:cytochrome P450